MAMFFNLINGLINGFHLLPIGGVMAVVTFNSLEDRLDRGRRMEDLCIKLGLEYNIYLRESISRSSDRQNRENADGSKL